MSPWLLGCDAKRLRGKRKSKSPLINAGNRLNSPSTSPSANLSALLDHHTTRWIILISAAFLLLFAQANQSRVYGDSLRYAAEARAMADSGEYATLRFGKEPNDHGPLLFWLTALAIKVFGPTPFAVTLFSRLFGLGCVILTGWLGSHLFGKNTGWMAALALATSYTFLRNAGVFRMDSGLTFGILLALAGYFRGERPWGPPLFYGGLAVAILAKSLPGFLPLFLVPFHSLLARTFYLPWRKQSIRWLCWSPLLLVPLAWWGYLAMQYGTEPFSALLSTLLAHKSTGEPRISQFFAIYVLGFAEKYWPWLPFALIGAWMLFRDALDSEQEIGKRAAAGLMLGWVGIVLMTVGLSHAQYERYIVPALPAISIITGTAIARMLRERLPAWMPGTLALSTFIGAAALACFPVSVQGGHGGEGERLAAVAETLDRRLPPRSPVPIITMATDAHKNPKVSWGDKFRCLFFFDREARPATLAEAKEAAARGRVTLIILKADYPEALGELHLAFLIRTNDYVLAESGSGGEILLPTRPLPTQESAKDESE